MATDGDGKTPKTRTGDFKGGGDDEVPLLSPVLGTYTILGLLGSGGMGVVYEARDERLGRRVAIKRLHGQSHDLRILREAQALARLAHPNVVSVYEIITGDSQLFIVMELVVGRTLRAWIQESDPSPRERLDALIQAGQGLAAAHAAGLVHRDLKPDNIMIGDDGRVRVMDFGLARAASDDRTGDDLAELTLETQTPTPGSPVDLLCAPVTVADAILGTPGYIAPESYRGAPIDVRSDIFAFSVVLFEALHGHQPFAAHDPEGYQAAILAGKITGTITGKITAVAGDPVPAWLERVIRRGLAHDPRARWPAMEPLLTALADDPVARRRRRIRAAALATLTALVAVGLTYGYLVLARMREAQRTEEAASARLRAVQATIERAEAEGNPDLAEAAFHAFVRDPAHHGSAAISHAWLWRGARLPEHSAAAFAEAYVTATTPEDATQALWALSEVFRQGWDGDALVELAGLLRDRDVDPAAVAQLTFEASLWRGDLTAAAARAATLGPPHEGWAPLLQRLSRIRETDHVVHDLAVLPAGTEARVAAYDSTGQEVAVLDRELREVGRWRAQGKALLIDRSRLALDQEAQTLRIVDMLSGATLGHGPSPAAPFTARLFDGDRDGEPELYFARFWPALGFRRWDLTTAREATAHQPTEELASVLNAATVGDLDGDGLPELAVAFGEWHAFDLRIFRGRADGELELVHHQPFGRIAALTRIHRGGRPLLVALSDAATPAPEIFPDPPHTGSPTGVHFFSWEGGALTEIATVPLPRESLRGERVSVAGDLDGDGDDDLAFDMVGPNGPSILILRQDRGGFESLSITGFRLRGGGDLDGDGTVELLARAPATMTLSALGVGDTPRPAPPLAHTPSPPPPLRDPLLRERWRRADQLRSLGLSEAAATSLYEAALVADDRDALALFDRAAALFLASDRRERALEIDRRLMESPVHAPAALVRSAETLHRLGRYGEAEAAARALLEHPGRSPEETTKARVLREEIAILLDPTQQIELTFDHPLRPEWQIHTPGALRRDPNAVSLEFTIPAGLEPVASLPLHWGGGPIALDLEIEVDRLEYGACIAVAIADAGGDPWLGYGSCGVGGGGAIFRQNMTRAGRDGWITGATRPRSRSPETMHIHLRYTPQGQRVELIGHRESFVWFGAQPITQPIPGGQHTLVIRAGTGQGPPGLAIGRIRRVAVHGARLAPPAPEERDLYLPARHLAEGAPLAALSALDALGSPAPNSAIIRLLAHAELADLAGLQAVAQIAAEQVDDPTRWSHYALLLREIPIAGAALRGAAGPRILPALQAVWEVAPPHRNDPFLRRQAIDALTGIEALVPTNPGERRALRELLRTRALMRRYSGDLARAHHDLELASAVATVEEDDEARQLATIADELAALPRTDAMDAPAQPGDVTGDGRGAPVDGRGSARARQSPGR